jgi:hypothetical protein
LYREATPGRAEAGTGLVGTLVGTAVLLMLILLATQVAFDLYARSVVGAVAFDAARLAAGADSSASPAALASAEQGARSLLGSYGRSARFSWRVGPDAVELTVTVASHSLLPRSLASPLKLDQVVRTVTVRRERVR